MPLLSTRDESDSIPLLTLAFLPGRGDSVEPLGHTNWTFAALLIHNLNGGHHWHFPALNRPHKQYTASGTAIMISSIMLKPLASKAANIFCQWLDSAPCDSEPEDHSGLFQTINHCRALMISRTDQTLTNLELVAQFRPQTRCSRSLRVEHVAIRARVTSQPISQFTRSCSHHQEARTGMIDIPVSGYTGRTHWLIRSYLLACAALNIDHPLPLSEEKILSSGSDG